MFCISSKTRTASLSVLGCNFGGIVGVWGTSHLSCCSRTTRGQWRMEPEPCPGCEKSRTARTAPKKCQQAEGEVQCGGQSSSVSSRAVWEWMGFIPNTTSACRRAHAPQIPPSPGSREGSAPSPGRACDNIDLLAKCPNETQICCHLQSHLSPGDVRNARSRTITVIQLENPAPLRRHKAQLLAPGPDGFFCVKPHQRAIKESINGVLTEFPIVDKVLVAPDCFSPV